MCGFCLSERLTATDSDTLMPKSDTCISVMAACYWQKSNLTGGGNLTKNYPFGANPIYVSENKHLATGTHLYIFGQREIISL